MTHWSAEAGFLWGSWLGSPGPTSPGLWVLLQPLLLHYPGPSGGQAAGPEEAQGLWKGFWRPKWGQLSPCWLRLTDSAPTLTFPSYWLILGVSCPLNR